MRLPQAKLSARLSSFRRVRLSPHALPDDGDLSFDVEGNLLCPNGLEYLFGVYYFKDGEKLFWAHNHVKNEKETFYMGKRAGAVATAADSIIVYNEWRETGADELLQEISDYNEVDCVSTHLLRDWLLTLKPEDAPWFKGLPEYAEEEELQRKDWEIEYEDYQTRLGVTEENPPPINERLSHLLEFHNREAKPQWWSSFERQNKFEDELIDDTECLGGLQQVGSPEPEKRSLIYGYRFPSQEYKLKIGAQAVDIAVMENASTIVGLMRMLASSKSNAEPAKSLCLRACLLAHRETD